MTAPKLRFKEFNGDWSTNKIEEISVVTSGGTPSRSVIEYWNGDIPWVTTSLVDFNYINKAEEYITQVGLDNSSAKLFPKDTILMAMYGQGITRGKVAILGIEATTNQACAAIKLKNSFDTKFIFQNLMNRYEEIRDLSNEGGQKNLSAGIIKEILISFPSKQEQTKVASFLSTVDKKISQLTYKHELLSQYKQGMMQKLFSQQIRFKADDGSDFGEWYEKKLSEICMKIKDGTHFSPKTFEVGDYKYLTSKNVKNGYLDFSKLEYVNKEEHLKIYSSCDVQFGDVLLTKDGTIGQCCVNTLREEFSLLSSVAFLRLKPEYDNYFLYHLLVSDFGQKEINGAIAGQALKRITLTKINDFSFSFPCLEEQTKIANFLSSIDQKIEVVAQQIEQAKTWKKGLLQQMFV
nr:restriction endonuclease subunit S [Acinetobacter terrae]